MCVWEREREITDCSWLFGWLSGPPLGYLLVWMAKWLSPDCLLAVCSVFPPVCFRYTEEKIERERAGERERVRERDGYK